MKRYSLTAIVLLIVLASYASYSLAAPAYRLEWIGQPDAGDSVGVALDAFGNAYISGTIINLHLQVYDAYLAKFDGSGALLWQRQLGVTDKRDYSYSVAVDALGNAYISGSTQGDLGGTNAGSSDAFLAKYDAEGDLLWTRQIGTSDVDGSFSVALDGYGNAYISGVTRGNLDGQNAGGEDAFLAKYDALGNIVWTRQLGTTQYDRSYSVAIDGLGNAYISGRTWGSLGGPNAGSYDAFLAKYDSSGALLWTRQLGTGSNDRSMSVAVDAFNNAYITGYTEGSLGGHYEGSGDAFLAKYDPSGSILWARQFGTSDGEESYSVAAGVDGRIYICGSVIVGGTPWSQIDAFFAVYDYSGSFICTVQIGGMYSSEEGHAVAVDALGNVYISGVTSDGFGGSTGGAFLAKFVPIPEPGTVAMIATAFAGLAGMALRRMRR